MGILLLHQAVDLVGDNIQLSTQLGLASARAANSIASPAMIMVDDEAGDNSAHMQQRPLLKMLPRIPGVEVSIMTSITRRTSARADNYIVEMWLTLTPIMPNLLGVELLLSAGALL